MVLSLLAEMAAGACPGSRAGIAPPLKRWSAANAAAPVAEEATDGANRHDRDAEHRAVLLDEDVVVEEADEDHLLPAW